MDAGSPLHLIRGCSGHAHRSPVLGQSLHFLCLSLSSSIYNCLHLTDLYVHGSVSPRVPIPFNQADQSYTYILLKPSLYPNSRPFPSKLTVTGRWILERMSTWQASERRAPQLQLRLRGLRSRNSFLLCRNTDDLTTTFQSLIPYKFMLYYSLSDGINVNILYSIMRQ